MKLGNLTASVELPSKDELLADFLHRCSGCPAGTTVHFYMYGEPYEVEEQWLANGRYSIVLKPKGVTR